MMLRIAPELWQDLCRTSQQYPTCALHLHQHEGWIKSFTVEHGPVPCLVVTEERMSGTGSDVVPYGADVVPQSA